MWATLAMAAALSLAPEQTGKLQLTNARTTYGFLGAPRLDSELLPGDAYFVTFDIENLTVGEGGRVRYSMGMELKNSQGKVEYKKEPQELVAYNSLGGNKLPAFAVAEVGTETAPGEYTLTVTVIDVEKKAEEKLVRKFKVLDKGFGLVRLHCTYLQQPVPAPPVGVIGQSLLVHCAMVGFKRDKAKMDQPDLLVEIIVLDETNKPTLKEPFKAHVTKDVDKDVVAIPLQLPLELNRAGKFTVVVKAVDNLDSKKTKELKFQLHVNELPK